MTGQELIYSFYALSKSLNSNVISNADVLRLLNIALSTIVGNRDWVFLHTVFDQENFSGDRLILPDDFIRLVSFYDERRQDSLYGYFMSDRFVEIVPFSQHPFNQDSGYLDITTKTLYLDKRYTDGNLKFSYYKRHHELTLTNSPLFEPVYHTLLPLKAYLLFVDQSSIDEEFTNVNNLRNEYYTLYDGLSSNNDLLSLA